MSKWRPGEEGTSPGRRTRLQLSSGQRDVHAGPPRACQVLAWAGGGLGWLHPCPRGGRGSGWLPQGSGTLSRSPRCGVPLSQAGVSSTCSSPGPARGLASLLVPCPSPASWALPPSGDSPRRVILSCCVLGTRGQDHSPAQTPILNVRTSGSLLLLVLARLGPAWGPPSSWGGGWTGWAGVGAGGLPAAMSVQVKFWAAGSSQVTPGLVHTGQLTPHNPNSGRGRAVPRLQGLGLQAREHRCGGPQSS